MCYSIKILIERVCKAIARIEFRLMALLESNFLASFVFIGIGLIISFGMAEDFIVDIGAEVLF